MLHWLGIQCENNLSYVLKMGEEMIKWLYFYADWGYVIKYLLTDKSRDEIASSVQGKNNRKGYKMVWIKK